MPPSGDLRLRWWEVVGLALVAAAVVGFGGVVVLRSAYQTNRKTDFGVYARAAHAVRTGRDIYATSTHDNNWWHYCYPPPFAVVMAPLADPYDGEDRAWYLPYGVSVAVWYAVSVGLLGYAADTFARHALPDAVRGSRRWWYARTVPVYVCVGGIGFTLSRGQVNVLAVALVAGMFAALTRGRPVRAGVWLAAAVALKVIPAFLVLYPAVRGQWRAAVGFAAGLVLFLVGLPAAVWGPAEAVRQNLVFVNVVLAPGLVGTATADDTRAKELTDATATDSQSFQAVVHNLRYPDRDQRPTTADGVARGVHWLIGGVMAVVTVAAGFWRCGRRPADRLVFLGCLCVVMLHLTPVSHPHYYTYAWPLVAGLWLQGLTDRPGAIAAGRRTTLVLAAWGAFIVVLLLPYEWPTALRTFGGGVAATVGLWAYGVGRMAGRPPIA